MEDTGSNPPIETQSANGNKMPSDDVVSSSNANNIAGDVVQMISKVKCYKKFIITWLTQELCYLSRKLSTHKTI